MAEKPPQPVETAPDPEEDDLDDLDDVLDEFNATNISPKPTEKDTETATTASAPSASGPGRPSSAKDSSAVPSEEEFTAKLQDGMAGLISELDGNPEMQVQFEQMMRELISAGAAPTDQAAADHIKEAANVAAKVEEPASASSSKPSSSAGAAGAKKPATGPEDFNDTIRRTMQRMQASDAAASTTTSAPQSEEALLEQMMRELSGGGAGSGEEDFNKMLLSMMSQLTNKEILYEPMKELHEKFPEWLQRNAEVTPREELERYKEQQRVVGEIVGRFERKGYSDDNEGDREFIVERMQKMQAAGSPPADLVGDMSAAQEALGDIDQGCPTQ